MHGQARGTLWNVSISTTFHVTLREVAMEHHLFVEENGLPYRAMPSSSVIISGSVDVEGGDGWTCSLAFSDHLSGQNCCTCSLPPELAQTRHI